ncbi:hypothetical protein FSP39_022292 [Pinctada imbricata]|uniref:Uncharacterized protein n=1 Tax=Pinctada imbricata TaxID=66713 RepID=A0AA88XDN5_PINIB|nr:hypothetical protein FSP39_022292 [Pinctada imbricata]
MTQTIFPMVSSTPLASTIMTTEQTTTNPTTIPTTSPTTTYVEPTTPEPTTPVPTTTELPEPTTPFIEPTTRVPSTNPTIIHKMDNLGNHKPKAYKNQDKTGTKSPLYEKKRTPDTGVRPGAQDGSASPACMQHPSLQFGRIVTSGYFYVGRYKV